MRISPFGDPRLQNAFRSLEEAVSFQRRGLFDEAEKIFARIVKKNPDYFDALHIYGLFKYQQGKLNDALKFVGRATKVNPRSANAFNSHGVILAHLNRHAEALASFDAALKLDQNHLQALSNRCNSLNEVGRYDEAINSSDRVLKIDPNYIEVYIPRAAALFRCHRDLEALESYDRAISLNPNLAMAWLGRGNICSRLKRHDEALAAYDKALALKADLESAWLGRANVCSFLKRYDDAIGAYNKVLTLKPDPGTEGLRLHAKMYICDWRNFDVECANLIASVKNKKANADPFYFLGISSSPEDQLQCAKSWIAAKNPPSPKTIWQGERYQHDKIRIAYVSTDFRPHAISALLAGMFESHDQSRFETTAISIGPDDQSEMRQRLKMAFKKFIDADTLDDFAIAARIRAEEIDLLIDLNGLTRDARTGIFAHRPAPVQVNYIGYPGTMGADYMNYIISDRTLIPESQQRFYAEKIVYLPDSYQANDDKRLISEKAFTRAEFGLPDRGFIFCCFNNNYKILPNVFDCWMQILKKVDSSVLWLVEDSAIAADNLRREAAARGVNPERLIFATRVPMTEHLARHRLADLFLDTLPYNAHTTTSDPLWAGLPLLTQIGENFAGRVAASLLRAIGMTELITSTQQDYANLAVELSTNPDKLATIRHKLAQNRLTKPLFNTRLFTRHIEGAY